MSSAGRVQVDVDAESLTWVLRSAGLEPHEMFRAAIGWLNPDETVQAQEAARREFAAAGLADGRGLTADALDWLTCLSRARNEYLAVFTEGDRTDHVLVAGAGDDAVIARRVDSEVRLERIRNEHLPETLLRALPPMHAGKHSVNVRLADLDQGGGSLLQDSIPSPAGGIAQLERIASEQAIRNGELYVGVRDHSGHYRINAEHPIRFRDAPSGRILIRHDGDYLSTAPATEKLFLERLHAVHKRLSAT